jgi:hypothetical protein
MMGFCFSVHSWQRMPIFVPLPVMDATDHDVCAASIPFP